MLGLSILNKGVGEKMHQICSDYCTCTDSKGITSDVGSSEFGYWDICLKCGKRMEDGFHYYNHCEVEDQDDEELY